MAYLFDKKEDKASNIAKTIKKSRAIVYKDLDELTNLKIVEKVVEEYIYDSLKLARMILERKV